MIKNVTSNEDFVKAEYDRVHMINALKNAIQKALLPDNIMTAWKVSHLYPFQENPYLTRDGE